MRSARSTAVCSGSGAWILPACPWRDPAATAPRSSAPPDPVAGPFSDDLRSPPETALDSALVDTTRIPSPPRRCATIPSYDVALRTLLGSGPWLTRCELRWRRIVLELKPASARSSLGQQSSGQVLDTPSTCLVRPTKQCKRMQSMTPDRIAVVCPRPRLIRQRPPASYRLSEEG